MSSRVITPPATWGVTVLEAKEQARVLNDAEDGLVARYLAAALDYCERFTGRHFESQVWEIVLDKFPTAEISLPGRIITVDSITYLDPDGNSLVLDPAEYVVDTASPDGWIVPASSWPTTLETINAVRIVATIGEGTPPDMKQAIVMLTAHYYAEREGAAIPTGVTTILMRHLRYAI